MAKPFANDACSGTSEWSDHRERNDFNHMLYASFSNLRVYEAICIFWWKPTTTKYTFLIETAFLRYFTRSLVGHINRKLMPVELVAINEKILR